MSDFSIPAKEINYPIIKEFLHSNTLPKIPNPIKINGWPFGQLEWEGDDMVLFEPSYESNAGEVLKNALTIYRFSGISENWIPINGQPEQYYVFKLSR